MKTTELKINNYVSLVFPDGEITVIIDGIKRGSIALCVDGRIGWYYSTGIKPIPLTEQWLLDFGFKICTKSGVHNGWGIGENPLTHDYLLYLVWMKNEDGTLAELFYRNGYHTIKYVHQLQNLYFALMQEELILKEIAL